jgi:K+-sensing histidine kinase KdpD
VQRKHVKAIASAALGWTSLLGFSILFGTRVELAFASVLFLLTPWVVSAADVASLCAFAAVALLTSHLSHQIHAQSRILIAQRERQRALYELATATLLLDWRDPIGDQICALVQNSVGARGVALLDAPGKLSVAGTVATSTETLQASLMANQNSDLATVSTVIRVLRSGTVPLE